MTSQLAIRNGPVIETEEVLLERVRRGDGSAFEALFVRHYAQVFRVLYGLTSNREEAEDLAQETFLALLRQPPAPGEGATLIAWLCRVGLNKGYNVLRGARRSQERAERLAELPELPDPYVQAVRAEERAGVRAALAELPEREGKLLLLRHGGLSYAEIAAAIDVAPGSIGTLLARAERAFLAAYTRQGSEVEEQGSG